MTPALAGFVNNQMAYMMQEMESEFSEDNEEQDSFGPEIYSYETSGDDVSVTTTRRSQSLSADFNRLTIDERVSSSSRSVHIHGSSSTTGRTDKSPTTSRHIVISGDHIEVDNNLYQADFDSNKVRNNIIKNSFGKGGRENIGVLQMLSMCHLLFSEQNFNPSSSANSETEVEAIS